MIQFNNVFKNYNNSFVINDLSFTINKGEKIFFIGQKNSGKTTIFNLITGEIKSDFGMILINGNNISTFKSQMIALYRKKLGLVFQSGGLLSNKTVYENIIFNLKIKDKYNNIISNNIDNLLQKFDLLDKKKFYPENLSFSDKKLVVFCNAYISNPDLLLIDNLFDNIEKVYAEIIKDLIMTDNDLTVVSFITNPETLKNINSKIYYLNKNGSLEKITKGYFEEYENDI